MFCCLFLTNLINSSYSNPFCEMYLAPRLHLPSEGADLHQARHCGGWFDSCVAGFLWHHALLAVHELDTRHSPLSYTQVTRHRAGWCPQNLPPGQRTVAVRWFMPFQKLKCVFVFELPCRAAVGVTWHHWCGFGKVTALCILHHLLPPFCLSSAIQHPVGNPSSTRYTADS